MKLNTMCYSCRMGIRVCSPETKAKRSMIAKGRKFSLSTRKKLSSAAKRKYENPQNLKMMADAVKLAMHRPDVRKRHVEALAETKWLGKSVDKGQLKFVEKWNRLGFKFEPNYQIHTDDFLAYVDAYDKNHGVILEYDSKYHSKPVQLQKDLIRQQKIIDILKPKRFWRYDTIKKQCRNVLIG